MSGSPAALPLFSACGIEIEYMVVRRGSHDVLPVTDQLMKAVAGEHVNDIEDGPIAWSNELVLHVLELKTNGPVASLDSLAGRFQAEIGRINELLADLDGRLMPTAMHPWMNPAQETRLWPHGSNEVYEAFNRIFDCSGHGWSNLQSMHVNLPFADDAEFRQLHTAVRTLLPIMPAIAASSPIQEWDLTGLMDTRLETYRHNSNSIPSVTGLVVPENAASRAEYECTILQPMYAAIAHLDPQRVLQHEWLNSRGAIARFDRNTIEIRVLDTQENPAADLAVAGVIRAALRALVQPRWSDIAAQATVPTGRLAAILLDVIRAADTAVIRDRGYLALFGFPEKHCQARELWQHVLEDIPAATTDADGDWRSVIAFILREGCLARRIAQAVGSGKRRSHVRECYRQLCDCLAGGALFEGIG